MIDSYFSTGKFDFSPVKKGKIVPDDENVVVSTNQGEPLVGTGSPAGIAYQNICNRLLGQEVPFMDFEKSISFWTKVTGLFHKV